VARRASTLFAADRRIARAMEFIRRHACTEGFGPRDVVREMGCSRTLADALFRKVVGRTILDEVHGVRLARAKDLLLLGKPADFVASECGYASYDDFCRVFKRRVGSTVRTWTLEQKHPV
jgi:LacI family transcriptional regulator